MNSYIARQPIFNKKLEVTAYELLYRDGNNKTGAVISDGTKATSYLLSDAINVFGLGNLTDHKVAYVNFTDELIDSNFAKYLEPEEVVIELLEDIEVTNSLIDKIKDLKQRNYKIALDDYAGNPAFDALLPYVDIIKVDFMITSMGKQIKFGGLRNQYPGLVLLAEKVETKQDYDLALSSGYELFQGYYFEKPQLMKRKNPQISMSTFNELLLQLNVKGEVDFEKCAEIIKKDAILTYRLLQKVSTLEFFRGNTITNVHAALVVMGQKKVRRWLYLMLINENNLTNSEEMSRHSLSRALFSQKVVQNCSCGLDDEEAYLLGMFSLLDQIMGVSYEELFCQVEVTETVRDVLLNKKENDYSRLLYCVVNYGNPDWQSSFLENGFRISSREIWKHYMESLMEADQVFHSEN